MLSTKFFIRERRDFRRLDLAAAAPENVGVAHRDSGLCQMRIDCGLVREHDLLFGAVDDAHDVDVAKLRAAFAPVRVRHAIVAPDFTPCLELAALRYGPMEKRVVTRDAFSEIPFRRLYVLEERREPPDDAALVKSARNRDKLIVGDAGFLGAALPQFADQLFRRK